ncbi:hypothetical protein QJS04_geneDACA008675 [Acorus gramineus]|uniref:DNA 3'-5' helicase n=1 Tax=Acorus gramineus TaxID=55184 RepID=A0AAV9ABC6_ACOGR|nr:hypothetical protein QJS04_geneDACA008675 [Acorus gramineus]
MNKENILGNPNVQWRSIADQQNARITHTFRAAKLLVPCKRPRDEILPVHCDDLTLSSKISFSPIRRLPLSEIQTNTCSPVSSIKRNSTSQIEGDVAVGGQSVSTCSDFDFDVDFDEETLREIDALCEQKSAEKERPSSDSHCFEKSVDVERLSSSSLGVVAEEMISDGYSKYLQSLSDVQREAACSDISIPLMIVAGPGSGKGIDPRNILAMTFTTAAAAEMRERIRTVAGKAVAKELMISTFHSFCLQLCRSHADKYEKLGRTTDFLIYGHGQQRRAVIEALRLMENEKKIGQDNAACKLDQDTVGIAGRAHSFKDKSKKWQKFVTQAKASGKTPEYCRDMGDETGLMDSVYKQCQDSWKAIVVDEFQDTSSMQYSFLRTLASHNHITVVGDEDQSIFSFNGANICGFDSFRKDFPNHKEIRLNKNYRSTRCIVEAASSLIRNNVMRCQSKKVLTDSSSVCKVSGKAFQESFRLRKIPFNVHGVAFYRKKIIKSVMAMLRTSLPGCDDGPFRQAFKALFDGDKEEKRKVIDYIEKISTVQKCSFVSAACDIFGAKISGTFTRAQLNQGRKVLFTLDMISKLVHRKYLLEQRAVLDAEGGKLLNEDHDLRSVLQYLMDDVSDFLSAHFTNAEAEQACVQEEKGCLNMLKTFIDYISAREIENFRCRKHENSNSVTLTTIHQSKGLEWDTVFIVKANDSEIPLLHECNGIVREGGTTLELLQPSRFLKEIPEHLMEVEAEGASKGLKELLKVDMKSTIQSAACASENVSPQPPSVHLHCPVIQEVCANDPAELAESCLASTLLRRFNVEDRSAISHLFHQWARKKAFQDPKRLLDKLFEIAAFGHYLPEIYVQEAATVGFVIDERLRSKASKNKDALRALKSYLRDDEAFQYAQYVLRWEQIPADQRAHLTREKQEHFQKQRIENSMSSSGATPKQELWVAGKAMKRVDDNNTVAIISQSIVQARVWTIWRTRNNAIFNYTRVY